MKNLDVVVTSNAFREQEAAERKKRVVSADETAFDAEVENALRPKSMDGYIGQEKVKENLSFSIASARLRGDALDHVLLYGPPGLGKTTLAHIIATELGSEIKVVSAPALDRGADLANILTSLSPRDVLFIDEIHRLKHDVAEFLYSAMEDFKLDLPNGKGLGATVLNLTVAKFTLVGATTRIGLLAAPLRDRFGIICRLETYSAEELKEIVLRSAERLGVEIDPAAAEEIARRSRGTPRIANRLLKRARDYSLVAGKGVVTAEDAKRCLKTLGIDELGLDEVDKKLLYAMAKRFHGGPCGLATLAATVDEDAVTIEDVYEPYLLRLGFIARTPRGRILLEDGYKHLGLKASLQGSLFDAKKDGEDAENE